MALQGIYLSLIHPTSHHTSLTPSCTCTTSPPTHFPHPSPYLLCTLTHTHLHLGAHTPVQLPELHNSSYALPCTLSPWLKRHLSRTIPYLCHASAPQIPIHPLHPLPWQRPLCGNLENKGHRWLWQRGGTAIWQHWSIWGPCLMLQLGFAGTTMLSGMVTWHRTLWHNSVAELFSTLATFKMGGLQLLKFPSQPAG